MGKTVVLAEKPSVGKEIARVLKANKKGNGCLMNEKYIITWALGHLVTLADPEIYSESFKTWNLETLPMLPEKMKLVVIKDTGKQFKAVREILARNDVSDLIIATDAGREGELVARWIVYKCGFKKPMKRLWISSQTDKAIKEGFASLKNAKDYDNLYFAAQGRAEADWYVGLNVTRALTCKFNAQLSAGRVQTPTLSMIVKREEEIKNFKPQTYYNVIAKGNNLTFTYMDEKNNSSIHQIDKATEIKEKTTKGSFSLNSIKKDVKKEGVPLLYDLTELQRDANKKYSFTAKQTLSIMQKLYEHHKILTYPRTDSRYLSSDIVPTLSERLKAIGKGSYLKFTSEIYKNNFKINPKCVNNAKVSDHHAIIPTEEYVDLSKLTREEVLVYDLVVKRFLACFYGDTEYEVVSAIYESNSNKFSIKGKQILKPGFKTVYGTSTEDELVSLPILPKTINLSSVEVVEKKTTPPKRYNEASLLSAMEHPGKLIKDEKMRDVLEQSSGLGTPATRADIIEKLFSVGYLERRGKEIIPTPKGIQLIDLVPVDLKEPELTGRWEEQLDLISKGKLSKNEFIKEIQKYAASLVVKVKSSDKAYKHHNITGTKCPLCDKFLLEVNGKKGKMLICQDRECGYKEHLSTQTFMRCPTCHKKMEMFGENEKAVYICKCGFREKRDSFNKRTKEQRDVLSKTEVTKFLSKQKKVEQEEESPFALALKQALKK